MMDSGRELTRDGATFRKQKWTLDHESFEELLAWLSADREQAGRKYEEIRYKLIKIFVCRGCFIAEELADETINRVAKKARELRTTYVGVPDLYFYGVARNVHLEYVRKPPEPLPPPPKDSTDEIEREYACLEKCMQQLTPQNRELVLQYYQEEKGAKIEHRRKLAERLGIALNALRIRAHRVRAGLRACVSNCLEQAEA